jgi:TRAP-type C4-dicarboxylate transport system substrate-binding protein
MTIQICMGGYGPATTTHSRALKIIGDRMSAQFGKDVDIKYVWNIMDFGYKGEEVLWMSERGILTLAYQSTSYLTERVPELEFADLPFLFASLDEARAAMDGALGAYLTAKIEERIPGYRMLGYFENGYRHISNRLRPIHAPRDMQGMTIRSLPSRMHAQTYELLGAIPIVMDLKPAIAALKAGEVDAQENRSRIRWTTACTTCTAITRYRDIAICRAASTATAPLTIAGLNRCSRQYAKRRVQLFSCNASLQ